MIYMVQVRKRLRCFELEHAPSFAQTRETGIGSWRVVAWTLAFEIVLSMCFAKMIRSERTLFGA